MLVCLALVWLEVGAIQTGGSASESGCGKMKPLLASSCLPPLRQPSTPQPQIIPKRNRPPSHNQTEPNYHLENTLSYILGIFRFFNSLTLCNLLTEISFEALSFYFFSSLSPAHSDHDHDHHCHRLSDHDHHCHRFTNIHTTMRQIGLANTTGSRRCRLVSCKETCCLFPHHGHRDHHDHRHDHF